MSTGTDETVQSPPGGWRRQFTARITLHQAGFDVLFGVVLPLLCFLVDPIFKPVANVDLYWMYSYVAVAMTGLLLWLVTRRFGAFFAGFFLIAAACAGFMGALLFPLGLMALVAEVPIGALGFIPLASSLVYLRNAWRAWRASPQSTRMLGGLLGLAFGLAPPLYPLYGHALVKDAIALARSGNEPELDHAVVRIRSMPIPLNLDPVVRAYIRAADQQQGARLAELYLQVSGKEIRERADRLSWD